MAIVVHKSNRAEKLVDALVDLVRVPAFGADVVDPEVVSVQGRGMERWLSLELAKRLGVWANPRFPFPRHVLDEVYAAVLGERDVEAARTPDPETVQWAIARLLPGRLRDEAFSPIRRYLDGDDDGRKRVALSARVAHTFDHYAVYRPEMVLAWERGDEDHWQAHLWRDLQPILGERHAAARARRVLEVLRADRRPVDGLFRRVSFFGLSTLPPLWMRVLQALSDRVEVHLFLLSPSDQYWAEVRSKKEIARLQAGRPLGGAALAEDDEEALAALVGNPLLASLGRVGRELQALLESTSYLDDPRCPHVDPASDDGDGPSSRRGSMLARLQSDVLHLVHRGAGGDAPLPWPGGGLSPCPSLSFASCHSPLREIEVLHDRLLSLFQADPTLMPRDVVVMAPKIAPYAAAIEAVFGGSPGASDAPRVPHQVADLGVEQTNEVVAALLRVLDVASSRMTATDVVDLLGFSPVRDRFGIGVDEIDLVRTMVASASIRWGVDEEHRAAHGQLRSRASTWRRGLERLLLGRAVPDEDGSLFFGVLPADGIEGDLAHLLGRFAEFVQALLDLRARVEAPLPWSSWRATISASLDRLLDDREERAHQHQLVRDALLEVEERAASVGFVEAVPLAVLRGELSGALSRRAPARGFLSGGVTFCELAPMRTIPFRVVCLVGMGQDAFPRGDWPLGFDLMADKRALGDRSPRDDDRYLFLEALLSARDHLVVSWVGQSIQDGSALPPSVVVDDLLDALAETWDVPCEDGEDRHAALRRHLVVPHPLQPFSPRYFEEDRDERLFSFSAARRRAAARLLGPREKAPPFVRGPLPAPDDAAVVTVDELVRFFKSPLEHWVKRRLGLFLDRREVLLSDHQAWSLDDDEAREVGEALLSRGLRGADVDALAPALLASGRLPPGTPGRLALDALLPHVDAVLALFRARAVGGRRPPLTVDGTVAGVRVTGALDGLYEGGQVRGRFSFIGGRFLLEGWIRHVLLSWAAPAGHPKTTVLVGRHKDDVASSTVLRPVEDAEAVLSDLLALYRRGQRDPVPLFRRASRDYARVLHEKPDAEERALQAARHAFSGDPKVPGDVADVHVRFVYGDVDPLADGAVLYPEQGPLLQRFVEAATRVHGPLLRHVEEEA